MMWPFNRKKKEQIDESHPVSTGELKLCRDCKHCEPGDYPNDRQRYEFAKCRRWVTEEVDLVSGRKYTAWPLIKYCDLSREAVVTRKEICGKEARYWEAK